MFRSIILRQPEKSLWWVAVIFVFAGYVTSVSSMWEYEGGDSVEYLNLAHSMLKGLGYTLYGEPYVLYPPLYPLLLSGIMMLFGVTSWFVMHLVNAICAFTGIMIISYWLRKRGTAGRIAAWLSLLSYYNWSFSTRFILSEPLYVLIAAYTVVIAYSILRKNVAKWWLCCTVGVGALLAIMTRPAALGLVAALGIAGCIRWLQTRGKSALLLVLTVLLLAGGFFAYWNALRPVLVDPNAPETHLTWALKFIGVKSAAGRMVLREDGVGEDTATAGRRFMAYSTKFGQVVTSIVRPPPNAQPLFVGCVCLFLIGVLVELKKECWSPVAWYALVYSGMIYMTKWSTNYQRYLYVLIPLLLYFIIRGMVWICSVPRRLTARVCFATFSLMCGWGICCFWCESDSFGASAAIQQYIGVLKWMLLLIYLVLFGLVFKGLELALCRRYLHKIMIVGLFLYGVNSAVVAVQRSKRLAAKESLELCNLSGSMKISQKILELDIKDYSLICSSPRVVSIMTGMIAEMPEYNADDELRLDSIDYVMLLGSWKGVVQECPMTEGKLEEATRREIATGKLKLIMTAGDSKLYVTDDERQRSNW